MTEKVLDFVSKRNENIEKKRRGFERLLFNNFLGAYSVLDREGSIYPVDLVDVSRSGCQFQVPWNLKRSEVIASGTEFTLRIYFTKHSYIPIIVSIKHSNEFVNDNGQTYLRYGCEFDKSMPSFSALESFIEFMYKFAEHSAIDKGDNKAIFF